MIYTIGYDHMTIGQLRAIMRALSIDVLVDVRSVPYSRKPGFSQGALQKAFGEQYRWEGRTLGGRPPGVTNAGLEALASAEPKETSLLLCKEEAPADCHRYHTIALPLLRDYGLDCLHVFEDELVETSELQASLIENRNYLCRTFTL